MSVQTVITITHAHGSAAGVRSLIRKGDPHLEATALARFFESANIGAQACKFDVQVEGGDSVAASGTLTVSTGVATDTAVVAASTLTCVDHRETTNITFAADVAGSLNSTYFKFQDQSAASKYYVWFNIDGAGVDPAVSGRTGIEVTGAEDDSAATLATAAVAACSALTGVTVSAGASGHIIVRNVAVGTATATADGTAATGFTFTRSITGSALSAGQYNVYATDTLTAADLARAINAHASLSPYVLATPALGVVTVAALLKGAIGNAIALSATGGVAANHATLTGGTNPTANVYHCGL